MLGRPVKYTPNTRVFGCLGTQNKKGALRTKVKVALDNAHPFGMTIDELCQMFDAERSTIATIVSGLCRAGQATVAWESEAAEKQC
jgi:hypothetical protein